MNRSSIFMLVWLIGLCWAFYARNIAAAEAPRPPCYGYQNACPMTVANLRWLRTQEARIDAMVEQLRRNTQERDKERRQ